MRKPYLITGVAISALLVISMASCHVTLKDNELGVVRRWGVVQDKPMSKGLHFWLTPGTSVELVTMEYDDINFVDTDGKDTSEIEGSTSDGVLIDIPLSVSWAINPEYLTTVKRKLPGHYYDREIIIIRSAVRDAIADFSVKDGTIFDRAALTADITRRIKDQTTAYYLAQGFGSISGNLVNYGLITLRSISPPDDVVDAHKKLIIAQIQAQAQAARTKVPAGRSVDDYAKIIQAQAISSAVESGKANVTVVAGSVNPVVAVPPSK